MLNLVMFSLLFAICLAATFIYAFFDKIVDIAIKRSKKNKPLSSSYLGFDDLLAPINPYEEDEEYRYVPLPDDIFD